MSGFRKGWMRVSGVDSAGRHRAKDGVACWGVAQAQPSAVWRCRKEAQRHWKIITTCIQTATVHPHSGPALPERAVRPPVG